MDSPPAELVQAARRHVPDAWNALLHHYELPLYAYIAELLRDRALAFDVVQETFIAAVRHVATLRDDRRFGSWLFGIAHQKVVQHWRQQQRDAAVFEPSLDSNARDEGLDGGTLDPRTTLLRREQADGFFAVLDQLPAAQRSALLLYVIEEFSLEEIALITDAPIGTVKTRLFHARRTLRTLLEASS